MKTFTPLLIFTILLPFIIVQAQECPRNEIMQNKGEECTCDNHCYIRETQGCYCRPTYVRNLQNICVPQSECEADVKCEENQLAVHCANPCPSTCEEPNKAPCPLTKCNPGCICKNGFVLNGNNTCVKVEDCPAITEPEPQPEDREPVVCDENAEFALNGTECECAEHCYFKKSPACLCKPGFIRRAGRCIPDEECIALQKANYTCTGPFEYPVPCEGPCQISCKYPNKPDCASYACVLGCRCVEGYIWDETIAKCVNPEECPVYDHEDLVLPIEDADHESRNHLSRNHHNRNHANKHHSRNHANKHHSRNHANKHHSRNHANKHHSRNHHNKNHHNRDHQKSKLNQ